MNAAVQAAATSPYPAAALEDIGCMPKNRVAIGTRETVNSNRLLYHRVVRAGLRTVNNR